MGCFQKETPESSYSGRSIYFVYSLFYLFMARAIPAVVLFFRYSSLPVPAERPRTRSRWIHPVGRAVFVFPEFREYFLVSLANEISICASRKYAPGRPSK